MNCPIFTANEPILLIGAGPVSETMVTDLLPTVGAVICADGGVHHANQFGIRPDLVIGDMDSGSDATLDDIRVVRIDDQNTTDFQKALAAVDAPAIIAVGFLGGRLDHQLANFAALLGDPRSIILVDDEICTFVAQVGETAVTVGKGDPIAFFPLIQVVGSISGVRWPVDEQVMAPNGLISTSNHATGGPITIKVDCFGLLCMVPRQCLDQLTSHALMTKAP